MSSTLVGYSAGCAVKWGAQRLVYSVDTHILAGAGTLSIIRQVLVCQSVVKKAGTHVSTMGAQRLVCGTDAPNHKT